MDYVLNVSCSNFDDKDEKWIRIGKTDICIRKPNKPDRVMVIMETKMPHQYKGPLENIAVQCIQLPVQDSSMEQ